jgi:hypothetical protein
MTENTARPTDGRQRAAKWGFATKWFSAISIVFTICCASQISQSQEADFTRFRRAAEYCSGNVKRPFALSRDKRLLCFDGDIERNMDISEARGLAKAGTFVVRSMGGSGRTALALAELLREREVIVVVYDYCLSACASFLLFASAQTFVLKKSLVAWHHDTSPNLCPIVASALDRGPDRLEKVPCSDASHDPVYGYKYYKYRYRYPSNVDYLFYKDRIIDPYLEMPPQSAEMRRQLLRLFFESREYPVNLFWTWNPRYYARAIRTKVVYEAYPESQEEVNYLALGLGAIRVLYDP